jgi:GTP-binding protein
VAHLQPRGALFVGPGEGVYEGMIVGENSRASDLWVNVTKEAAAAPAADGAPRSAGLIPPRSVSLEQALEFIRDDERVELTPRSLRLRKRALTGRAHRGRG